MIIFNTLSRQKQEFVPLKEKEVSMYVCGPTVYDMGHIGHGRAAVTFDIVRRFFLYEGYAVKFVSNYTDIDDKMIKRAEEKGITVAELAEQIIPEYKQDFAALGVMSADVNPKATEYIPEMIELIQALEKKGITYMTSDGVYFDVTKFPAYGKLSGQKLEELQAGARVDVNDEKKNPQDFVLWKLEKPGEPAWESPWGRGRPGWHIECSAMTWKTLGVPFDIHGGGQDLIFPHHECEVAQSESALDSQFAKYWMHNGFITINHEKMSKSLGNFFTIRDVLKKYPGRVIRMMYLQTHYRSPIDFSDVLLDQSREALKRIDTFMGMLLKYKMSSAVGDEISAEMKTDLETAKNEMEAFMQNDLDTSGAFGVLFSVIKKVNVLESEKKLLAADAAAVYEFFQKVNTVFQVFEKFPEEEQMSSAYGEEFLAEVTSLVSRYKEAKTAKNYADSDAIRKQLQEKNIFVEDTKDGVRVKVIDENKGEIYLDV